MNEWTEEHFEMFELVELAIGHYKEATEEEKEDRAVGEIVAEKMAKGDDSWRDVLSQHVGDTGDDISIADLIDSDDSFLTRMTETIDKELIDKGITI